MIDRIRKILCLVIVLFLVGCSSTWINLDSSKAQDSKISRAKEKCEVDKKLYNMSISKNLNEDMIFILEITDPPISKEAKQQLRDLHNEKERKMWDDINKCMRKEGLKQIT
jgi:hypothetical protein